VLLGERCTEKVDIFSFGVVLWELVTGERPTRGGLRLPRWVQVPKNPSFPSIARLRPVKGGPPLNAH
jgi:serine/threonine protein kinase